MFQKATKSLLQRVSLVLRRSKLRGSARDENLGTVVLVFAYTDSSSIMVAETYVGINIQQGGDGGHHGHYLLHPQQHELKLQYRIVKEE